MPKFRFNHMELSFEKGTLTQQFRDEVDAFYGDVLGWRTLDTEVIGQLCHLLLPDDGQFILLAEGKEPISSPGYDHLGSADGHPRGGRRHPRGVPAVRREGRPHAPQGLRRSRQHLQ